jgi:hypothetical protein
MKAEEVNRREAATLRARRNDATAGGAYFRVWQHLREKRLITDSGDRAGLGTELNNIRRRAERSLRRAGAERAAKDGGA